MPRHTWTPADLENLREMWGKYTIPTIAKKMGRSYNSIVVKAKRLGMSSFFQSGEYINACQIADLMNVDIHAVTHHWPKNGLQLKEIAPRGGRVFKCVKMDRLFKWLEKHQDLWDSRRVELYAFGHEPDWLKQKRRHDMQMPERKFQKWTPREDASAVCMFKQGASYRLIGEQLGRSTEAVERRIKRLDVWGSGGFIGEEANQQRRKEYRQNFANVAYSRGMHGANT